MSKVAESECLAVTGRGPNGRKTFSEKRLNFMRKSLINCLLESEESKHVYPFLMITV